MRGIIHTGIACAVCVPALAGETIVEWANPAGGLFSDGANWVGGVPPLAGQVGRFDLDAAYTVGIDGDSITGDLAILDDINLDLGGFELFLSGGLAAVADLSVNGGSLTMPGDLVLSVGPCSATPPGLEPFSAFGTGHLTIANATVQIDGLSAGGFCADLNTNLFGGRLEIGMGGALHSATAQFLGSDGDESDVSLVIQEGGLWETGSLYLADRLSLGTFRVEAGGTLDSGNTSVLGIEAGLVSGPKASWNTGQLSVGGCIGSGGPSPPTATETLLVIDNGATVSSTSGFVSNCNDFGGTIYSDTRVRIDGTGSTWAIDGPLQIGEGEAAVEIVDGGVLQTGGAVMGGGFGVHCEVIASGPGSNWTSSGVIVVEPESGDVASDGTLTVLDGATVVAEAIELFSDSGKYMNGRLTGDGTVQAMVSNNGEVGPGGVDPGTLTVNGPYVQGDGARLVVELGGPENFDALSVLGDASLSGRIEAILIDRFVPQPDDRFMILTAGALAGEFGDADLPELSPGSNWFVRYLPGGVELAVGPLSGDANGDGNIDGTDLEIVLNAWGPCPSPPEGCPGDTTGDGMVTVTDLIAVLVNWAP